ncbi:MAG: glycosyltransferase family 4 protein [Opitutaceae bacterium]|nr:glycosyltransferase family 4 protein [Opitutaceae bacterium]
MKILFVSPLLYHSACGNGGGILCFEFLKRLAREYTVALVAFYEEGEDTSAARAELARLKIPLTAVERRFPRHAQRIATLGELGALFPREAAAYRTNGMSAALRQVVEEFSPDVVVLQFPVMAHYVTQLAGTMTVMDVQDVFSVSRFRAYRAARGRLDRMKRLWTWLAWQHYEAHFYPRFDHVLAISPQDEAAVSIICPETSVSTSAVAFEVSPSRQAAEYDDLHDIVMAGNFGHPPNLDGLTFFVDHVVPLILREVPDVSIRIAGRGLPESVATGAPPAVRFEGFVPDIRAFFSGARVAVTPVRFGGGVKIKTVEAMSCGAPVVATPVGAEGIGATDGHDILIEADAADFASSVIKLLRDSRLASEIGENGRRLIAQNFSWERKINDFRDVLSALGCPQLSGR